MAKPNNKQAISPGNDKFNYQGVDLELAKQQTSSMLDQKPYGAN